MTRTNPHPLKNIGALSRPLDRIKVPAREQANMTPSVALQPQLQVRLQSLVDSSSAPPLSSLELFEEAGLNEAEINSLVFANQPSAGDLRAEDTMRLKRLAAFLAHCLQVYGSNAIGWLRQPLQRFNRRSPLEFLKATRNFDELDGYLIEASEGYFF